jgi:hypothetical protein
LLTIFIDISNRPTAQYKSAINYKIIAKSKGSYFGFNAEKIAADK